MRIHVNNEYGKLKSVVVSSADYYNPEDLALNNETIKYYALHGGVPTKEDILREQKDFWDVLKSYGVDVRVAAQVEGAKGQMFTRDLAFVIGEKLFISRMKKENRRAAIEGWEAILSEISNEQIVRVPDDIILEGGDVLVDGNTLYVGVSERTNMQGVEFLKDTLGSTYKIVPLQLKEKFLHLDVVLTIVNPKLALVYRDGLEEESYKMLDDYEKIEITEEEQFELGTNVFVLDEDTVIVNAEHKRIIEKLEEHGLTILPLDFSETAKDGGAFRCTTCPLERE